MERMFLRLVSMSLAAGWMVLAVIAVRWVLRRSPRWVLCLLWALVALRLVCPVTIESPVSLMPRAEAVAQTVPALPAERAESPAPAVPERESASPVTLLSRVWLAGMSAMLLWALWSDLRLRRRVRVSIPRGGNVRLCDAVDTPFVLGVVRPRIYLPSGYDPARAGYVLAHERAHIARRDHWWKPLGWLLLSVYWFHPLLWAAYLLFCRDLELACDERVARGLDREGLAAYSETLLRCSPSRRGKLAFPVAFGEVGVKTRVRAILRYRRHTLRAVLTALLCVAVVGALFLTERPARAASVPAPETERAVPAPLPDESGWTVQLDDPVRHINDLPPAAPDATPESAATARTNQTYQPSTQQSVDSAAMAASSVEYIHEMNERAAEAYREAAESNREAGSSWQTVTPAGPTSALPDGTVSNPTPLVAGANANGIVGSQINYGVVTQPDGSTAIRLYP